MNIRKELPDLKVFLDDERIAPDGWIQVRRTEEAISLLKTACVSEISLDHDLGDDERGTGYDVLLWMEEAVATGQFIPPVITIHSANSFAKTKMQLAVDSIEDLVAKSADLTRRIAHREKHKFINGIRSLGDTLYWMEEAIKRHQKEIAEHLYLPLHIGSSRKFGMQLSMRLDEIQQILECMQRDIAEARHEFEYEWDDLLADTKLDDLTVEEVNELKKLDTDLNNVGAAIGIIASKIDASLSNLLQDPSEQMCDRNLDIEFTFFLKSDDPGAESPGRFSSVDDTLSTIEISADRLSETWPDGYDDTFRMPHGGLLHTLRLYGGAGMSKVDYRDILRAGTVWVDIKVDYQYCYDLIAGKWIKRYEDSGNVSSPVYVKKN